ncbi:MAG: serine/threonine-protein kinase [Opitutaceae bacterium]
MTDTPKTCPNCDASLPADSPHELCPTCLLKQAFLTQAPEAEVKDRVEAPSPESIADKFPQFEIAECLGQGGMGVVYKARQKSLNRWVAIKILSPEKVGDGKFADRFTREAQTLAQLNHKNIVTIFDYGEVEGLYYIVMEFIDGINLRDLLNDGQLQSDQALRIVTPICEALQYAHNKGIVHRDIKPENILIDHDGRIKVADFGIASLIGSTGELAGTPPYMAPEQDAQTGVDHRADIYALGAVLYEMLTGERPNTPLDLPSQKVELDIRIDDIVLRALSQEPERRYQTAYDFRTVVQTVAAPEGKAPETGATAPESSKAPTARRAHDPRITKGLGLLLVIWGALNLLSLLASFVLVPLLGAMRVNSPAFSGMGPLSLSGGVAFTGPAMVLVVLMGVLSLIVSTLCVKGGLHMYRGTSRNWTIAAAVCCCLTPMWWPVGLILGVGVVVYTLIFDSSERTAIAEKPAASAEAPRLCILGLVAFCIHILSIFILFVFLFFLLYFVSMKPVSTPLQEVHRIER